MPAHREPQFEQSQTAEGQGTPFANRFIRDVPHFTRTISRFLPEFRVVSKQDLKNSAADADLFGRKISDYINDIIRFWEIFEKTVLSSSNIDEEYAIISRAFFDFSGSIDFYNCNIKEKYDLNDLDNIIFSITRAADNIFGLDNYIWFFYNLNNFYFSEIDFEQHSRNKEEVKQDSKKRIYRKAKELPNPSQPRWAEANRSTELLQVRIRPKLKEALERAAREQNQSKTDWVREALEAHLERTTGYKP